MRMVAARRTRRHGGHHNNTQGLRLRQKNTRGSPEMAASSKIHNTTNEKCLIVQDFEKEVPETKETLKSLSEVQDEFMDSDSCCPVSTPDSGFHDMDSSPLTKLKFKPETEETVSKLALKLIGTRKNDRKNARAGRAKSFQLKDSLSGCTPSDHLKRDIIKCSAEIGFSQCSKKYGISVETIKSYILNWINPDMEEAITSSNNLQNRDAHNSEEFDVKSSHLLRNVRGRSPRNAKNNSDLSELPLSHVKLMRKKLLRSINIDKKGDINKKCFRKKKLKGTAKIMRQKEKVRSQLSDLTAESEQKTSSSIVKSEADVPSSSLLSSVTVFDADVARPSRPIHRPVRYLDSLNQNAENFAVKKLNIVDKFDLPYDKDSLVWNKQHSKNKQNIYCYCGTGGSWHCKMVSCVRCGQWFHERCLSPRPYNMPIIPGDTAWLFVCSICNSGSECLKRMDMSWTDIVHLALFDLTQKTLRRHHDYDRDIMPHILGNWDRFQLYKHHNVLSEEEKRMRTKEVLITEKGSFESGSETRQGLGVWALRRPAPPPRPLYKVPDIGIVSERTVLSEFSISSTVSHERTETFIDGALVKIYKDYDEKTSQVRTEKNSIIEKRDKKVNNVKTKKVSNKNSSSSHEISSQGVKLLKTAKVEFKQLKLPKEILSITKTKKSVTEAKNRKLPSRKNVRENAKARVTLPDPKPLPYEIARMLHKKGYPKVAIKFASIIPPKREAINLQVIEENNDDKEAKSKKKKSKKEVSSTQFEVTHNGISDAFSSSLDTLIPERPNFLGDNNPFHLGSMEELRAARNFLCNRKLKKEDLTKCRSKIKKRKYRLNFEQARKMWKKESSEVKTSKTLRKNLSLIESKRKMQYAGKFTALSGETKIIMLSSESQQSDPSNDVEL